MTGAGATHIAGTTGVESLSKRNKFNNVKTEIDGITFDSKAEAARYYELKLLQRAGMIADLRLQVPFVLAPAVKLDERTKPALRYYADFVYFRDGKQIVEDVKGQRTQVYKIKQHLMKSVHGIDIVEIKKKKAKK